MKINDKIKTKRGYTGTIVDMVHMKDIRVVLDGCTYSDSHKFDILPLEDIMVVKEYNKHKHNYIPYEWENKLDYTNTQGNYVKVTGGRYTTYICLECSHKVEIA